MSTTAHVTGNVVLIGAGIVDPSQDIVRELLALPVFVLAVAATRLFVLGRESRGASAARGVLVAQALFLLLLLLAGIVAAPIGSGEAPPAILAGMMGVIAMAIQNAASRTAFAALSPTTVVTGNVTQIVVDLVDIACWSCRLGTRRLCRELIAADNSRTSALGR